VTYRYGWNAAAIGFSLAAVGFTSVIVQAVLVGPFVKRFGERASLLSGLAFGMLGLVISGSASSGWMFYTALPFLSLWGLSGGPIQSMMTRAVSPQQQGELQGTLNSLRGLAALFGPAIFTSAFAFGIGLSNAVPGAAWYVGAILMSGAIAYAFTIQELKTAKAI
jgi:DHA1 family tetracycline resistance protein-like MFS transporter